MAGHQHTLNRRERLLRRFAPLATVTVVVSALVAWAFVPSGGLRSAHSTSLATEAPTADTPMTTVPATTVPPTTTSTTDAGSLPQTETPPSSSSPRFQAAMQALFASIVAGTPATASSAFFPESAYLQLKSIAGASSDYQRRLVGDYDLDIMAAHIALGAGAPDATLTAVQVPSAYSHWVPSGECENTVGYFEVANGRFVYTEGGTTRSFGIASLISWRGEWYVVHLGAILRSGSGGVVLDPEAGPGASPPSNTC